MSMMTLNINGMKWIDYISITFINIGKLPKLYHTILPKISGRINSVSILMHDLYGM